MNKLLIGIALVFGLQACAHNEAASSSSSSSPAATNTTKESGTTREIRKRAAFDLGCPAEQIQVTQIEEGSFMHAASYGASCGEKRVSYLERMGTIIKQ
jgi:hypothetical protein